MKKYLILFIITATVSLNSVAQSKDESAIRAVMNNQIKAWNNGNIDAFMQSYWKNDSLLFVGSKGPAYGWKTTLEHYKKNYPDTAVMGKLSFEIIQVKMLSEYNCFVLGKWHLIRKIGDAGGYFTLLFQKINGHWLIIADHTS